MLVLSHNSPDQHHWQFQENARQQQSGFPSTARTIGQNQTMFNADRVQYICNVLAIYTAQLTHFEASASFEMGFKDAASFEIGWPLRLFIC